jgi:uncharacterized protein (TIGR04255 family)
VDQFLRKESLGELEPTGCLMTYVNHITIESLTKQPDVAEKVFTFWSNETTEGWLPNPDQLVVNLSYPMPENKGRLHVQVVPAIRSGNEGQQFVLRFELTARGRPQHDTVESALEWLDVGHEWIVRGFVNMTRKSWHETDKWGRFT